MDKGTLYKGILSEAYYRRQVPVLVVHYDALIRIYILHLPLFLAWAKGVKRALVSGS